VPLCEYDFNDFSKSLRANAGTLTCNRPQNVFYVLHSLSYISLFSYVADRAQLNNMGTCNPTIEQ
jgi:hypothetical protein